MSQIDPKVVMKLRAETDAGMMDCKKALVDATGDYEKAKQLLRERGAARSEKLADRPATVGAIGAYVHPGGRVAALVELACNTDFVASNAEFQGLLKDLAVAVAAFDPRYIGKEDVPAEVMAEERKKYEADIKGKPPAIAEKILEGKIEKNFLSQVCLLHLPYPKEDVFKGTYGELIRAAAAKLGENLVVRRFYRMELGR